MTYMTCHALIRSCYCGRSLRGAPVRNTAKKTGSHSPKPLAPNVVHISRSTLRDGTYVLYLVSRSILRDSAEGVNDQHQLTRVQYILFKDISYSRFGISPV